MLYVVAGIMLGIIAGFKLNVGYDPSYAVYISLVILAIIDVIITMICDNLKNESNISKSVLLLAMNFVFAMLLGFVGEQLGLPIYLAAVFAFGNNMYRNFTFIAGFLLEKYQKIVNKKM